MSPYFTANIVFLVFRGIRVYKNSYNATTTDITFRVVAVKCVSVPFRMYLFKISLKRGLYYTWIIKFSLMILKERREYVGGHIAFLKLIKTKSAIFMLAYYP